MCDVTYGEEMTFLQVANFKLKFLQILIKVDLQTSTPVTEWIERPPYQNITDFQILYLKIQ